jgi:hypothetical protein
MGGVDSWSAQSRVWGTMSRLCSAIVTMNSAITTDETSDTTTWAAYIEGNPVRLVE